MRPQQVMTTFFIVRATTGIYTLSYSLSLRDSLR
eukprot:COSAG02_NODE_21410_length_789_cov_0.842029_1_plen_33_part_10